MHDLLATAFVRLYPARVVAQARARLAAAVAAGADVNGDTMQALNRCVRGGDTIKWFEDDKAGRSVQLGVALCLPLQIYLNKLFAAARDILAYRELTFTSPPGHAASAEDLVDLDKKMKNAIVRNWNIISGFEGEKVAKRYSALYVREGEARGERKRHHGNV